MKILAVFFGALLGWAPLPQTARAAEAVLASPSSFPSLTVTGVPGLNTVPDARLFQIGTIQASVSRLSPYTHASFGIQATESLYLGLRQTAESRGFSADPARLFPGLDLKYRLVRERKWCPEISLGLQSALTSRRFGAEYLALSKQYESADMTVGLGWGRLGSRHRIESPVTLVGLMSERNRSLEEGGASLPKDWFRGGAGVFLGMRYTPEFAREWSLKADLSSEGWDAERRNIPSFTAPSPWGIGVEYHPPSPFGAALSWMGDRAMIRITLHGVAPALPVSPASSLSSLVLLPHRGRAASPRDITDTAWKNNLDLTGIRKESTTVSGILNLEDLHSSPAQIGMAARHLSNLAGREPETLVLFPRFRGLDGASVSLNRRALEQAIARRTGSAEEIWHTAFFNAFPPPPKGGDIPLRTFGLKFALKNDISLSEEDSGLLYRTALSAGMEQRLGSHVHSFTSLRLGLFDNLPSFQDFRHAHSPVGRTDIDLFTQRRLSLEKSFVTATASFGPGWHSALSAGYLEEMYAGAGAQILYRPWGKNYAAGFDIAQALPRDPETILSLGLSSAPSVTTGHATFFYEVPNTGLTAEASLGRYLAGDWGGTVSLSNRFLNGVTLGGFVTSTNGTGDSGAHESFPIYSGIGVSIPIGGFSFVPDGTRIETRLAPLGRRNGQKLDLPERLYEATEPLSFRHITQHWSRVAPPP